MHKSLKFIGCKLRSIIADKYPKSNLAKLSRRHSMVFLVVELPSAGYSPTTIGMSVNDRKNVCSKIGQQNLYEYVPRAYWDIPNEL
ncbi:hypothetical protein TNCV_1334661 [Trichonephila clavipes]|nr:hypothetical protein TNCV_1334661 [Trichonephila clavipes]